LLLLRSFASLFLHVRASAAAFSLSHPKFSYLYKLEICR